MSIRHDGDTVVVINLRQVVTAENSTNESIANQQQSQRQPDKNKHQEVEEDTLIVDAIETMVLPQTQPSNSTGVQVTIDEAYPPPPADSVASDTTDPCSNANANTNPPGKDDLEYGNTSRHLRPSLRRSSYPAANNNNSNTAANLVTSSSQDEDNTSYSKYDRPSRLRSTVMTFVGIILIVGGLVWAAVIYLQSPEYVTTESGQPLGAVLCSRLERDVAQQNASAWVVDYIPQYQQECNLLQERQRPCSFAISYTFAAAASGGDASDVDGDTSSRTTSLTDSNITSLNTTVTDVVDARLVMGFDVWTFDSGNECHESVANSRQTYLQSNNFTIFYDYGNPEAKNHYHQPPTAGAIAGIIAGIACGVGILFLCTSVLECILI